MMINFTVNTNIGGAICVLELNKDHYIEVRKDVRKPGVSFIEAVKNGHVYWRSISLFYHTPDIILKFLKSP